MIKIIKPGKMNNTVMCPNCGCVFTYDQEDIQFSSRLEEDHQQYYYAKYKSIKCPYCENVMAID